MKCEKKGCNKEITQGEKEKDYVEIARKRISSATTSITERSNE